jgi:hypothetical protein
VELVLLEELVKVVVVFVVVLVTIPVTEVESAAKVLVKEVLSNVMNKYY